MTAFAELVPGDIFDRRDGRIRMAVDGGYVYLPNTDLLRSMSPGDRLTVTRGWCPDLIVHPIEPSARVDRPG